MRAARSLALGIFVTIVGTLYITVPAFALTGYGPGTPPSFGERCPGEPCGPGQFQGPFGVATNDSAAPEPSAGDVYVVSANDARVEVFDSTGSYVGQFTGAETPDGSFSAPEGIAVDNDVLSPSHGDVYVVDAGHDVVDKFAEASPGDWVYAGQLKEGPAGAFLGIGGIAVDSKGDVWVLEAEGGKVDEFSSNGGYVGGFEDEYGHAHAIALLPDGSVLLARGETGAGLIELWSESGGLWSAVPFAEGAVSTALAVEPATEDVLVDQGSDVELWSRSSTLLQSFAGEGTNPSSYGVAVGAGGTAYVTQQTAGDVEIFDYGVLRAGISAPSTSNVGSSEATVTARIDAYDETTSYKVEYGPTTSYGSSTAEVSIGAPSQSVNVEALLPGLRPGVEYHYRFVASNSLGTTVGQDSSFTTLASGVEGASLPDHRAFELVSSPSSNADVYPAISELRGVANTTNNLVRAAENGNAVVYIADPPSEEGGAGSIGPSNGNTYIARRRSDGWEQVDLQQFLTTSYQGFSGELTTGVFNPELGGGRTQALIPSATPAAPPNCSQDPLFSYTSGTGDYHALFSTLPTTEPTICRSEFAGGNSGTSATPSYTDLLFQSGQKLAPGAVEPKVVPSGGGPRENLYDAAAGELHLVSVLPDGEAATAARFVGTPPGELPGYWEGEGDHEGHSSVNGTPNDISADGSRVFWTDVPENEVESRLFVRENPAQPQSPLSSGVCTVLTDACTVQLDVAQPGAEGISSGGEFWAASSDGSKVFFTDASRLTADSRALPGKPDLYEYEVSPEVGHAGRLVDLTAAEDADVQGVIGASDDGEYVYFVADGVLTVGDNSEGLMPVAGRPNLYLRHDGSTIFVARLEESDDNRQVSAANTATLGDWLPDPGERTAEVTPDGRSLVYRASQVYVYNAATERLTCVSCSSSAKGGGGEAYLPPSFNSDFMPRWISENGARAFFDTSEALVPQDVNGVQDVYEWERPASASEPENTCTTSSAAFSTRAGGCLSLLSGGTSTEPAFLLDASANGNDVFVISRGKLASSAEGENMALYDVRVDGGFTRSSLACTGTGCQGVPPAAPQFATPASTTFSGTGNFPSSTPKRTTKAKPLTRKQKLARALKVCRKDKKKPKRQSCERKARNQYGPVKKHATANRASNSRRASR